ncbi:MAG: hypothetical protein MK081_06690 [Flavobacteriales bacterium]|nr:hypothetical protein [Flavobacteriales bacterium]
MKIKTAKDVELLDQKIKDELGIDVCKYGNEEVVENFIDLLIFPSYVIQWAIRPVLIAFLVYILGFFLLDLVHVEYVLYGITGLVLIMVCGVLSAVLFVLYKMRQDMGSIVKYSLEVMKSSVSDIKQVNSQTSKENRKDVMGMLFKGIVHIVTIPMVSPVISNKVPLIGWLISRVFRWFMTIVTNKVNFDEEKIAKELADTNEPSKAIAIYTNSITRVMKGMDKMINIVYKIAGFPFKLVLTIVGFVLVVFLWLVN